MTMSLLLFLDGFNQSLGNTVEADGVNRWLGGKYSSHSIGRHVGVIGDKDTRHLVGGWRVRRGVMAGFIGHMSVGHRGRLIEDVKDKATDAQAGFIDGTCRGVPCRRRGV